MEYSSANMSEPGAECGDLCRPEDFGDKRFLLKSIAYNATARSDMVTLPCSNKVMPVSSFCDH